MTTKTIAVCDHEGCKAEVEINRHTKPRAMGLNGWGSFTSFQPQDFCPIHWPQYCKDNDINPETGQYN